MADNLFFWRDPGDHIGDGVRVCLHSSHAAALSIGASGVTGADDTLQLRQVSAESPTAEAAFQKFPHLRGCKAFSFVEAPDDARRLQLVTSQACVTAMHGEEMLRVTRVQLSGMLDERCVLQGCLCTQPAPCLES